MLASGAYCLNDHGNVFKLALFTSVVSSSFKTCVQCTGGDITTAIGGYHDLRCVGGCHECIGEYQY